jgi:hypothetical protein
VDGTVDSGLELMKHISSDEALQLKDKLDSLQRRFNDLTTRGADLLKHAQVRFCLFDCDMLKTWKILLQNINNISIYAVVITSFF